MHNSSNPSSNAIGMDTPEPTPLRAREFTKKSPSTEVDEQLGQAGLVVAAATSISIKERRAGNPPLESSELGQAQASTVKLANMIQAREHELPGALETLLDRKFEEMMTAAQTTLGDRLTAALTTLEDRLTGIENNIAETREEFKTFKTTVGQWSRPFAHRYNRECFLGTGFQPVTYPNGEFPDEATMARLRSRSSILNLDNETLAKICTMYGIKYPKRVAQRDSEKMKQDLLNHLCGVVEKGQVDEEEGEDDEEEADDRE